MRNLDRENSFQLQVAPSNIFVEKCKSLRQKHFGFLSQAYKLISGGSVAL